MRFLTLAAAGLALAFSAQGADAQTKTVSTKTGEPVMAGFSSLFRETSCRGRRPKMSLGSKPKNGRVIFRNAAVTVPSGKCKGKQAKGVEVIYVPNPGFRGTDTFAVRSKSHDNYVRVQGGYNKYRVVVE